MRNASGHQCKETEVKKKVNEDAYDISSIKRFLEVSRCSHGKQRQRNLQKKCAAVLSQFVIIIALCNTCRNL